MKGRMGAGLPAGARRVLRTLAGAGYEAWLVGGCVRDLLRGASPQDWDICTAAPPEAVMACFAARPLLKTGLRHGTVTVLEEDAPYEITTYRREGPYSDGRRPDYVEFVSSLEADLARRDFTMNAIAMGEDGRLRDPFGGAEDIRARRVRCVGEPDRRFREDGLRIMRGLRFGAALGYELEGETARAIHENRAMLGHVAAERINAELGKLLAGADAGGILRGHQDVLCQFWPELGRLDGDGWARAVHAVEAAPAETAVRLAALLHAMEGADAMLRALKFDNRTRKQAVRLVELQNAPISSRESSLRAWLGRLGREDFFRLLEFKRALAGRDGEALEELGRIEERASELAARGACVTRGELAVNGRDALAAGIPPGPEVGRALERILGRVAAGALPNERRALLEALKEERNRR